MRINKTEKFVFAGCVALAALLWVPQVLAVNHREVAKPVAPAVAKAQPRLPQASLTRRTAEHLPDPKDPEVFQVTGVEDGDTIDVTRAGKRYAVRLVGINAPELAYGNIPTQCFGLEARGRVKTDLLGKSVVLVADPKQGQTDQQGRLLRYAYLDGNDYNRSLIAGGFAKEFTYHSSPHHLQPLYQAAEQEAEQQHRGLWSTCQGDINKPAVFQDQQFAQGLPSGDGVTCAAFASNDQSQRFYESHGGPFTDRYGLDPDHDGRACEDLP